MITTTKIRTDLNRPGEPVTVYAVQGDRNSRRLELTLTASGSPWTPPENTAAALRYRKPDGTLGYYDTMPDGSRAWEIAENTVSILLAPQILTVPGTVDAQLELMAEADLLGACTFRISVKENPAAGVQKSEDYVNWMEWMVAQVEARVAELVESGGLGGSGEGTVQAVAGVLPEDGNVPLQASHIGALPVSGGTMTGELAMGENPLSGLATPEQEDQAANKGYVDEQLAEVNTTLHSYTDQQVLQAAPVNLLDNSDFRNPVNQRGETSYKKSANGGYTIDRWAAYQYDNVQLELTEEGLSLYSWIYQPIDEITAARYADKAVTVAVMVDGVIYCSSGTVVRNGSRNTTAVRSFSKGRIVLTQEANGQMHFALGLTRAAVVSWCALYPGAFTADNLPDYRPKGYGVELAECRRYYSGNLLLNTMRTGGDYFALGLTHNMRATPTLTLLGLHPWGSETITTGLEPTEVGLTDRQLQYVRLPDVAGSVQWGTMELTLTADL